MMVVEHRLARMPELEPRADFTHLVMAAVARMPAPAPRRSRMMWLGVYDLLAWAVAIMLTATGVLRWKTLAAAGGLVEGAVLLLFLYAGRHYLARVQSAIFGAQTT